MNQWLKSRKKPTNPKNDLPMGQGCMNDTEDVMSFHSYITQAVYESEGKTNLITLFSYRDYSKGQKLNDMLREGATLDDINQYLLSGGSPKLDVLPKYFKITPIAEWGKIKNKNIR